MGHLKIYIHKYFYLSKYQFKRISLQLTIWREDNSKQRLKIELGKLSMPHINNDKLDTQYRCILPAIIFRSQCTFSSWKDIIFITDRDSILYKGRDYYIPLTCQGGESHWISVCCAPPDYRYLHTWILVEDELSAPKLVSCKKIKFHNSKYWSKNIGSWWRKMKISCEILESKNYIARSRNKALFKGDTKIHKINQENDYQLALAKWNLNKCLSERKDWPRHFGCGCYWRNYSTLEESICRWIISVSGNL